MCFRATLPHGHRYESISPFLTQPQTSALSSGVTDPTSCAQLSPRHDTAPSISQHLQRGGAHAAGGLSPLITTICAVCRPPRTLPLLQEALPPHRCVLYLIVSSHQDSCLTVCLWREDCHQQPSRDCKRCGGAALGGSLCRLSCKTAYDVRGTPACCVTLHLAGSADDAPCADACIAPACTVP